MHNDDSKLIGYRELTDFLIARGYPLKLGTVQRLGGPATNLGPPREGYWGRFPIYKPERVLEWARARIKPTKTHRPRKTSELVRSTAELDDRPRR
jgi:hypothetical protein